jgi:xanthine dehydrogenase YagR molybdenum-binding subunit
MKKVKLRVGFEGHHRSQTHEIPNDEPIPWDADAKLNVVGKATPRIDGHLKVSGEARYTHDVRVEGMLYAAVLRSPHPSAILRRLDLAPAEALPGVRAVLALAEPESPLIFAGQDVAAVAADRPEIARRALSMIAAEYEARPFVVDTQAAMKADAPAVHADLDDKRAKGNVLPGRTLSTGDVKKGMAAAKHRFQATYTTSCQLHTPLETHGLVVRWDAEDSVTVWASTQGVFSVRDEMAEIFDLKPKRVRVITEFMGGGFGSKLGGSAPGSRICKIAGELARKAKQPVHLMLDRREELLCTGNRPDSIQHVELGADKGGRLTAIAVEAYGSAGIGTGAGVGRNAYAIYTRCPNIHVASSDVFTHAGPGVAFRAPGHTQGAFAIESAIDELARSLSTDPLQLRIDHDEHPLRRYQFQIGGERVGWKDRRSESASLRERGARIRRGIGTAASIWGDWGRGGAVVTVVVERDGDIELRNGVQDIGTGIGTVLAQVVAEVLARPLESISIRIGDSDLGPGTASGGSTTTSKVTPAARRAAERVKAQLLELAARKLGGPKKAAVKWEADGSVSRGDERMTFLELCKRMEGDAIIASETRPDTYGHHPMKFPGGKSQQIAGVQFAEVEVDTWTGIVRCKKVTAIHDCGRVMNPLTVRSQINGGIITGTGYALLEERVMDHDLGVMLNGNLESYKIAGAADVPEIDIVLTEVASGANNTGAIGIGEPATIPTAAAIANAVGDALGVHVRSLPLTPARVLEALASLPGREEAN